MLSGSAFLPCPSCGSSSLEPAGPAGGFRFVCNCCAKECELRAGELRPLVPGSAAGTSTAAKSPAAGRPRDSLF
jgi:hypothetical protein